jgi:drug/metabolite transporter (DMT)-like permease
MDAVKRHLGLTLALAAAMTSGFAVFINGVAVKEFDDATVYTTAKNLVAGVVLAMIYAIGGRRTTRREAPRPDRRTLAALVAISVIGGAVPFVLFFEGLSRASSTNAAFIHKTLVIWVAIGAAAFLRERVTMLHAAAIGLLVLGQLALASGVGAADFGTAEVLVLLATLLWACEVMIVKRVLGAVPSETAALARMAGGGVLLLAWVASTGRLDELASLSAAQLVWLSITGTTLATFVSVWYRALAHAPAVDVSAVLVLGAVVTAALDRSVRDVPFASGWYGYVLITIGVIIVAAHISIRSAGAFNRP